MILSFLFYGFLIYILYKLVFDFVIPVYRTTMKVKKGFREMNERMRGQGMDPGHQGSATRKASREEAKPGEYIDFEEVKD